MERIQELITLLLIIIPLGGTVRITLCILYAHMEEDPKQYRTRARNALIFIVLAETFAGIFQLVLSYFGGGVIGA